MVVVSIFVNPAQFNQKSDLIKYPRPIRKDLRMCQKAGVNFVWMPEPAEMYPHGYSTWVEEQEFSKSLCGASRPGHFRGVCTIVLKLFNIVQPDLVVFGQKDAQQTQVVRKMVDDLDLPIRLVVAPIVREPDGLAMSSRNQRLSRLERKKALALYDSLRIIQLAFNEGMTSTKDLRKLALKRLRKEAGLRLDYLEFVDPETLDAVSRLKNGSLVALAAFVGKIRLIDNLTIEARKN
jgi:pantoate--beta-alanine ligase